MFRHDRQIRDCGAALLRRSTGTRLLIYDSEKIYSNRPLSCYLVLGSKRDSSICYRAKFIIKMLYCLCRLVSTWFALDHLNFGDLTALISYKWYWCTLTNTMCVSGRQLLPFALPTTQRHCTTFMVMTTHKAQLCFWYKKGCHRKWSFGTKSIPTFRKPNIFCWSEQGCNTQRGTLRPPGSEMSRLSQQEPGNIMKQQRFPFKTNL